MNDLFLSRTDIARRWKIALRTVDYLRAKGLLPWLNISGGTRKPLVRFRVEDVEAYEARMRINPATNNLISELKRTRQEMGLTVEAAAEVVKVAPQTYRKVEAGENTLPDPVPEMIRRLRACTERPAS